MARSASCVACGRPVSETVLEDVIYEGFEIKRCRYARDCFVHWPEADRFAVAKALSRARHPSTGIYSGTIKR